jgi:hypothetical protein
MSKVTDHRLGVAVERMFVAREGHRQRGARRTRRRRVPQPATAARGGARTRAGAVGRESPGRGDPHLAVGDCRWAAHRHARARAGHRREHKQPAASERIPAINTSMHLIATTGQRGRGIDREQLVRTGDRVRRPRARRDPRRQRGLDRRERPFASGEEMLAPSGRGPLPARRRVGVPETTPTGGFCHAL